MRILRALEKGIEWDKTERESAHIFMAARFASLAENTIQAVSGELGILGSETFVHVLVEKGKKQGLVLQLICSPDALSDFISRLFTSEGKIKEGVIKAEISDIEKRMLDYILVDKPKDLQEELQEALRERHVQLSVCHTRPKFHFSVIDGKHVFLEEVHNPDPGAEAASYFKQNARILALRYTAIFQELLAECVPLDFAAILSKE